MKFKNYKKNNFLEAIAKNTKNIKNTKNEISSLTPASATPSFKPLKRPKSKMSKTSTLVFKKNDQLKKQLSEFNGYHADDKREKSEKSGMEPFVVKQKYYYGHQYVFDENTLNEIWKELLFIEETQKYNLSISSISSISDSSSTSSSSSNGSSGNSSSSSSNSIALQKGQKRQKILVYNNNSCSSFKEEKEKKDVEDNSLTCDSNLVSASTASSLSAASPYGELHIDENILTFLKPHQIDGIKFMWNNLGRGGILAHIMGLGKTLQVIVLLMMLQKQKPNMRAIIVVPLSLVENWDQEYHQWSKTFGKNLKWFKTNSSQIDNDTIDVLNLWKLNAGVLLIHYQKLFGISLRLETANIFKEVITDCLFADEAHIVKSIDTQLTKSIALIKTKCKFLLTGTPMQNNLKEYYTLVSLVRPYLLGTPKLFESNFLNPILKQNSTINCKANIDSDSDNDHHDSSSNVDDQLTDTVNWSTFKTTFKTTFKSKFKTTFKANNSTTEHALHDETDETNFQKMQNMQKMQKMDLDFVNEVDKMKSGEIENGEIESVEIENGEIENAEIENVENVEIISSSDDDDEEVIFKKKKSICVPFKSKKTTILTPQIEPSTLLRYLISQTVHWRGLREINLPKRYDYIFLLKFNSIQKEKYKQSFERAKKAAVNTSYSHSKVNSSLNVNKDENITSTSKFECSPLFKLKNDCLVIGSTGGVDNPLQNIEQVINSSIKIKLLIRICKEAVLKNDRILVFTKLIKNSLRVIEKCLEKQQIPFCVIDSTLSPAKRVELCNQFENSNNRVMLLSGVGAYGLNITAANRAIIFDVNYNPADDIQSAFRIYRMGQKKNVFIYKFVTRGTIEEMTFLKQLHKIQLTNQVCDDNFKVSQLFKSSVIKHDDTLDSIARKSRSLIYANFPQTESETVPMTDEQLKRMKNLIIHDQVLMNIFINKNNGRVPPVPKMIYDLIMCKDVDMKLDKMEDEEKTKMKNLDKIDFFKKWVEKQLKK